MGTSDGQPRLRNAKGYIDEHGRECLDCRQYKPKDQFPRDKRKPFGMFSYCKECMRPRNKARYQAYNKQGPVYERLIQQNREARRALRREVIYHYGAKCSCRGCGVDQYEFLSIDHVNNDGAEHRRAVGRSERMLRDIKRRGFPPDFQVLCFNCNAAKSIYGKCPGHRKKRQ